MQQKSKSSIVFALVAVVAVGSTIASAGIGGRAKARLADAKASMLVGTASDSPIPWPEHKLAKLDLDVARAASASGDRGGAVSALVRVLERAERIDRGRSVVASLVTATLIDGVTERVNADPSLLEDARLGSALRRTTFASSRRPLEAERLHALGVLAKVPSQVPIRTGGLAESTTTQAMVDVDATLHAMEDSALAGDVKQCEAAALAPKGLAKQVTVGPSICRAASRIVTSGNRLRVLQARARASTQPSRWTLKTARVPVTL